MLDSFLPSIMPFISKQAISKARQGVSHKTFMELFRLSVKCFYQLHHDLSAWNGFLVYAVNGSTIQIPESDENSVVFGGNSNKTGKLSPLASVSVLYDVLNNILVDVSLHPYRYKAVFNEPDVSFTYPASQDGPPDKGSICKSALGHTS